MSGAAQPRADLGRVLTKIQICEFGSANVGFAPQATELLRGSEMTRRATNRHPNI